MVTWSDYENVFTLYVNKEYIYKILKYHFSFSFVLKDTRAGY